MNDSSMRPAGWTAIASGLVGILALIFLAVFFGIEFQPSATAFLSLWRVE